MKTKQLILLVIVGAVLGGVAWLTSRDTSEESSLIGAKLLTGVDVNAIDEIIISAGSDTCRVVRNETGWIMPDRFGYAANFSKIRDLLLKLDGLEIGQIAEVSEDQKSELAVTATTGTTIKLYAGGAELAAIILGDQRERQSVEPGPPGYGGFPDGRYVSADGGATVCLVGDPIHEAATQIEGWLDTEILNITGSDILRVKVTPYEGDAYEIVRDKDNKLTMAGMAENEEYDTSKSYSIESALSYLNLKDIADPELGDTDLGFDKSSTFQAWTKEGKQFDVTVSAPVGETEDRYARITVQYVAPETPDEEEPGEDTEEDTKDADVAKATQAEVKTLNDRLGKWTFRLQAYKAGAFCKQRSELLKEPEPQEEEETATVPITALEQPDDATEPITEPEQQQEEPTEPTVEPEPAEETTT